MNLRKQFKKVSVEMWLILDALVTKHMKMYK